MSIVVANWGSIDLVANPWVKRMVLVTIAIGAVLPLAMLKDMAKLSKTSFVSLMSVVFIIGVVLANAISPAAGTELPSTAAETQLDFIDANVFPAIGIISFAFVCHHACFIVYNTLRDNTDARWAKTVHLSIGVALGVMMSLAVAAYLTFRGIMKGSFLTNYSATDELVNVRGLRQGGGDGALPAKAGWSYASGRANTRPPTRPAALERRHSAHQLTPSPPPYPYSPHAGAHPAHTPRRSCAACSPSRRR